MTVEFPLREVSEVDLVFPVIKNMDDVLEAIPNGFPTEGDHVFEQAGRKFAIGDKSFIDDLANYEFVSPEDAQMQGNYMQVWAGSFEPRHEDKERVLAWLLSLALRPTQETDELAANPVE